MQNFRMSAGAPRVCGEWGFALALCACVEACGDAAGVSEGPLLALARL